MQINVEALKETIRTHRRKIIVVAGVAVAAGLAYAAYKQIEDESGDVIDTVNQALANGAELVAQPDGSFTVDLSSVLTDN